MPEVNPPLWQQNPDYPAAVDRELFAALTDGPGVAREGDLQVSPGSGLSVDVSAGHGFVDGTEQADQGRYLVASSSTVNVPLSSADPSNPRYDLIVARVQDAFYSGAVNEWAIEAVTGTAASSPLVPAAPANALELARVFVDAGAASIDPADVVDLRSLAPYKAGSPIGTIVDYAGAVAPAGWVRCDGGELSRTLYAPLFDVIGTTFGSGDGSTTFAVPDLRGRVRVGRGTLGADTYALADTGGAAQVTLSAAEMPSHTHSGPSHQHSTSSHSHSTPNHAHSFSATSTNTQHSHSVSNDTHDHRMFTRYYDGSTGIHDHASTTQSHMAHAPTGGNPSTVFDSDSAAPIQNDTHNHSVTGGGHTHSVSGTTGNNNGGNTGTAGGANTGSAGTGSTGSAGSGQSHENRPPYMALTPIIRAA